MNSTTIEHEPTYASASTAPQNVVHADHVYDGISEYDNPTPGWWHLFFILTVVFSLGYWVVYQLDPEAPTLHNAWADDAAEMNKLVFAKLGTLKPDEATITKLMEDPTLMSVGAAMFRTNCVACHGPSGEGQVGPNLTDDHYKNVKSIADIASVIANGANNGAMPAWKNRMTENEVVLMSSYIASLRGKNLPGRAPEGEKIAPWPKAPTGALAPAAKP
jgi:cytochrome c oxidase cbb3-type subunit 3